MRAQWTRLSMVVLTRNLVGPFSPFTVRREVCWSDPVWSFVMGQSGMIQLLYASVSLSLFNSSNHFYCHTYLLGAPSPPSLSLHVMGNTTTSITPGMTLTATCHAREGNPPPVLSLYKNDQPIGQSSHTETKHSFIAAAADNTAVLRCEAINRDRGDIKMEELVISVQCKYYKMFVF